MRLLILGLGNVLRGDDGVGVYAAKLIEEKISQYDDIALRHDGIDVKYGLFGGVELLYEMLGYDKAIILDSLKTSHGKVGDITRLGTEDLPEFCGPSLHDMSIREIEDLGKHHFPDEFPSEVVIFSIEVMATTFKEGLSEEIKGVLPQLVNDVLEAIRGMTSVAEGAVDKSSTPCTEG